MHVADRFPSDTAGAVSPDRQMQNNTGEKAGKLNVGIFIINSTIYSTGGFLDILRHISR